MAKKKNATSKVLRWSDKLKQEAARIKSLEPPPPPPPVRPPLRPATREEINRELRRIAFFDPRQLFDEEGKPIPITELDDDTAAVICGLEAIEQYDWDRATPEQKRKIVTGMLKKYNISSKVTALTLLDAIEVRTGGENAKDHLRDMVNALKEPDNRRE